MNEVMDTIVLKDGRHALIAAVPVEVIRAEGGGPMKGPGGGPCLDFIASTGALDRYEEIIEPSGWRLDAYRRNPVFQNAHRYGDVANTLGRALVTEVRELGGGRSGLFQRVEFATEVNPAAKVAYGLYRDGFLRAVSVGFIPIRWEDGNEQSGFRRRYLEQELLEVSAVAVPANPEALIMQNAEDQPDRKWWDWVRELREVLRSRN